MFKISFKVHQKNDTKWFCAAQLKHRRLKFYAVTHNNPKNPEYLIAISFFVIAGKTLDLSIFVNFGAQFQAPVTQASQQVNESVNGHFHVKLEKQKSGMSV